MPRYTPELTERAFAIADIAMRELVYAHCIALNGIDGDQWGLVNEQSCEVESLADADPAVVDAVEWLQARGLATIESDTAGAFVRLLPQPKPADIGTAARLPVQHGYPAEAVDDTHSPAPR